MKEKHPEHVFLIIEKTKNSNLRQIEKKKIVANKETTVGVLYNTIKQKINISAEDSFFFYINNDEKYVLCNLKENFGDLY